MLWSCAGSASVETTAGSSHSHDGTTHTHADDEASISVTLWTDELELFMEHPVLRVGRQAKFAVHLTKLSDFQPVTQGPVLFQFVKDGTAPKMVTVGTPEVPGIFGPTMTFEDAGEYTLHLEIQSDEIEASLQYGPIEVLEGTGEAETEEVQGSGQAISYLKEQQWKLPFASAVVAEREIHETVRVPAEIKAKTGMESVVTTAIGGRYEPPDGGIPSLGARIRKGDLLGYVELLPVDRSDLLVSQVGAGITISRLSEDVAQAQATVSAEQARLELAEKEAKRVSALVDAEALPRKRLDEVHSELEVRKASLEAAQQALMTYRKAMSRYDSTEEILDSIEGRLPLYAPISGQLVESRAVPGQYVDGREMLFRIVDLSRVWVEGQAFEKDLPRLENLQGGILVLPGLDDIALDSSSLILVGSTVHPTSRTLAVVFEIENRERRIKLGSLGRLDLKTGEAAEALAVPKPAVLLEENRSVVYVQLGGETFGRRLVKTGVEDQNWVQILDGLEKGERIVTVGAYNVALAARSTEVPKHGHVH